MSTCAIGATSRRTARATSPIGTSSLLRWARSLLRLTDFDVSRFTREGPALVAAGPVDGAEPPAGKPRDARPRATRGCVASCRELRDVASARLGCGLTFHVLRSCRELRGVVLRGRAAA